MAVPEVSHGRGGAGNINPDDTQYVDGEVVRVGPEGSHGDGAFSTGRGGMSRPGPPPSLFTFRPPDPNNAQLEASNLPSFLPSASPRNYKNMDPRPRYHNPAQPPTPTLHAKLRPAIARGPSSSR